MATGKHVSPISAPTQRPRQLLHPLTNLSKICLLQGLSAPITSKKSNVNDLPQSHSVRDYWLNFSLGLLELLDMDRRERGAMKALILLALAGLSISTVHAAEPTGTLTLACQGTVTIKFRASYEPDPISMGLIVSFTNRTVKGTARWGPYLFDDEIPITNSNEDTVVFSGFSKFLGMTIHGSMDRVTGDVGMVAIEKATEFDYSLKCKPTQRMF
jgi:hypothetical protein